MFLALNICCVSLGTVRSTVPLTSQGCEVGAKQGMKGCRHGKGTMFTASFRQVDVELARETE